MRLRLTLAALAGLAVAAPADAKEISKAVVCGVGECTTVTEKKIGPDVQLLGEGGEVVGPPAEGAPHYTVTVTVSDGVENFRFESHWAPSLGLVRGDQGTWMEMPAAGKKILATVTAGLKPFAASELPLSASAESKGAAEPVTDNVTEVFAPAQTSAPAEDGAPWLWIALAAGLLAAGAVALVARARSGGSTIRPWASRSS